MKRTVKGILAVLLTAVMLISVVPVGALAVGGKNNGELETDTYVKGSSSVGTMLAETLENAQNEYESDFESGAFVSGLDLKGLKAKVNFSTQKDAKLIVAVYAEDSGKMLTSGVKDVSAEETSVTVDINKASLPQYYRVKAFLIDADNMSALCSPYTDNTHTQAYIDFMSKDVNDFDSDKVINLDDSEENNFLVVAENAEKIVGTSSKNILVSADYDNGVYEFKEIDDSIKNLKPGNVFYFGGLEKDEVIKIKTIKISGTKATIVSDDFELEDAFEYIKIDSSEIQQELSTQSSGAKKAKKVEHEESLEFFDASFEINYREKENGTRGFQITHHVNKEGLKVKETPDSEKDWNDNDGKVLANVKADVKLKVDFKVYIAKKYKEISFSVTGEAGITLNIGAEFEHTFKLGKFEATFFKIISVGVGIGIKVNLKIIVTVSGTLTFKRGFEVKNGEWNIINDKPAFKPEVKVEGEIFIGIVLTPYLNLIDGHVVNIEAPITVGPKLSVSLSSDVLNDPNHDCNACLSGSINVELEIKADVWICNKKHNSNERHWKLGKHTSTWYITDFYFSITHGKFGWGKCPYIKAEDDPNTGNEGLTGAEKTGDIIKFGSYPQSKVTDSATISALDSVAKSWKSYNYYSGMGDYRDGKMVSSDYMQYADIKIDGAKYRAVKFTQYRPYCTGYISSSSGSQQDNNGYTIGDTFYFKYEPLKWRVLDASTGFIVCDSAIDSQPYNNYVLYADDEYWGDSNKKYFASNWENSSLRAWLNNEFYNTAFTEIQQNKIQQLTRKNKNKFDSKFDGNSTSDKITLLSYEDILNTKYGFESSINKSDAARKRSSSDYAKCQGINVISNDDNPWLLRTPSYSGYAACLGSVGYDYITYGHCSVGNTDFGIVPALNLSVSSSASDGTESNDSVFTGTEATGTIINFGSYPQSRVNDTVTINNLDSVTKNWKSYNYYSGTGNRDDGNMISSDYMKYADFLYGDSKYRAVNFCKYRPFCTGYYERSDITYQDNNGYYTNNVYYFKYEPLKWRVLDASTGLVICDSVVDSQPYNNYILYSGSEYWGDSDKKHYASNWEYSSLRAWLNNEFYNTAFSKTQQDRIKELTRENKSTYSSKYDSNPTSDKITLLSYNDVLNTSYRFISSYNTYDTARQHKSTAYAQCQGCWTSTSSSYSGNSFWWLRSPELRSASDVGADGRVYSSDSHHPGNTSEGVLPALNLTASTFGTSSILSGEIAADEAGVENSPKTSKEAQTVYAPLKNGEFTLGSAVDGNRYMVYGVTDYSDGFTLTSDNLVYIDCSEGKDGKVTLTYKPSRTDKATVIVVGDFGSGIEAKKVEFKTGYTVTWNIDGKTVTEIYAAGDKLTPPTVPAKSGYTFKGWDKSVPSTMPANDLTFTAVYEKNVEKKNVKSVSIDDISLNYKKSTTLKPTIKADDGAKYKVEYSTSNAKVATVDKNGKVTATKRGSGSATITCTVTDSNGNVVKDTCKVSVSLTWWQWIIIIVLFGWIWY